MHRRSASRSVSKFPSDFDIFSLATVMNPLWSQ